ncbi:MAG: SH3 domain-containing protein [Thermoflexales bacterium]
MSVQKSPDRRGGVDNSEIEWEQDLRPFTRLPREPRQTPRQAVPAWIPALVSAAFVLFLCGAAASFVNDNRPARLNLALGPTATFVIATTAPTERIPPTATPYVAPTDTPVPTALPGAPATPGAPSVRIGGYVRIVDTGPNGLNFRKEPSRTSERIRSLAEGSVFEVVGGPTSADGLTWWKLKDADGNVGWGASDYLQPAAKP